MDTKARVYPIGRRSGSIEYRIGTHRKGSEMFHFDWRRMKPELLVRKLIQIAHVFAYGDIGTQQYRMCRARVATIIVDVQ